MDEQVVASHIAQVIGALTAVFIFLAKYREVLSFIWQLFLLAAKPFQCFWRWIKLARKIEASQQKHEERFELLEKTVKSLDQFVREKLSPNGGSSPVDAIKRIENRQIASDARQAALLNDANDGIFYCDVNGRNSWVNRTYARFLGCGTNELLGLGWKKFIHTDELKRYHQVWSEAFADGCEFEDVVTFYDVENKPIKLKIAANAIQNEKGETVSYIGQVIKV
jgi:PAS domain S-box-containing protein